MKKREIKILVLVVLLPLISCERNNDLARTLTYDFANDEEGWTADFADYPVGEADAYELHAEYASLPSPLSQSKGAFLQRGNNQSDDLFMFIKKRVSGLAASRTYSIKFTVEFASNVPDGTVGIGGSPGESVFIKAGATAVEPMKIESSDGYYRMNIDKGNQQQGGQDMIVIGDFSNDTDSNVYTLVSRTNETAFQASSDANGQLWLIVGTDSGFEGTTTIFYNKITVTLR